MIIVGLMTGTSADALDLALVDFSEPEQAPGHELVMELLDHREIPFSDALGHDLLRLLEPDPVPLSLLADVDSRLGILSAEAVEQMLAERGVECDLVVSHGQTVQHLLVDGDVRGTLQIGQPAWIAERIGCAVLSDVRSRDVTVGGQGAPLASMLDQLLLAGTPEPTAALNLGGIANLTIVAPGADPLAYDTGPANALIDVMARRISGDPRAFDRNGTMASSGEVDHELLDALLDEPYYRRPAPKSTGKELFHRAYLEPMLTARPDLDPDDVIATLTRLTAETVAAECHRHGVTRVVASGGGTHNPVLMAALADALGRTVVLEETATLGLPGDAKEATLMALLGWLSWHGLPGTLPSCTGASRGTLAGRFTPGEKPLQLPEPRAHPPHHIRLRNAPVRQAPSQGDS